MNIKLLAKSFALIGLLSASSFAMAGTITCGDGTGAGGVDIVRTATLGDATACETGTGNAQLSDIQSYYGDTPAWSNVAALIDDGTFPPTTASDGVFSLELTTGIFGSQAVEGTWQIASSFWDNFSEAVISMHVGNGGGDPDHWAWKLEDGATSGTFSYEKLSLGGGGFSNLHLWGRGDGTSVPAPASITLLGLGLLGLAAVRRRKV